MVKIQHQKIAGSYCRFNRDFRMHENSSKEFSAQKIVRNNFLVFRSARGNVHFRHNKKLFWIIIVLIVILIILIYFIRKQEKANKETLGECKENSECVPATCCHPDSCITKEKAPECKESYCTMVCSGPLDCGAGSCSCVKGKCGVVKT